MNLRKNGARTLGNPNDETYWSAYPVERLRGRGDRLLVHRDTKYKVSFITLPLKSAPGDR